MTARHPEPAQRGEGSQNARVSRSRSFAVCAAQDAVAVHHRSTGARAVPQLRMTWVAIVLLATGCATAPKPRQQPDVLHGVASWYGEEFAGRTTANGEIFDPLQLTAAHRTLPFGTVVDVTNPKTNQTVRVRINDRGPYVGTRIIDLSYAAAQQITLVDPGSGIVDLNVVKVGRGEREPPAPYVVTIEEPKEEAPQVAFPLPAQAGTAAPSNEDFRVEVVTEKHGVETRRQVSADGKTIEDVPVSGGAPAPVTDAPPVPPPARVKPATPGFVVQVGAFSVEENAKALKERLDRIGQPSYIDHDVLFRVRIGPFATRDAAVKARTVLEANGMSAIVVSE